MDHDNSASARHGRINLEQQRKRAKDLLRGLQDGTAEAHLAKLKRHSSMTLAQPRLADAQWLIAHQLGFSSWPRLKAHIDEVTFEASNPKFAAEDEHTTVHWRCGNDISHSLDLAGFRGDFKMFTDPLCIGPVPAVSESELINTRSEFISGAFSRLQLDVEQELQDQYQSLARLYQAERAVFWCDADPYDQLFLVCALASLRALPRNLEVIEVDRVPGVGRFVGIGQLAPEMLTWLWPKRRQLGEDALELARTAWRAYRAPTPHAWADLAHGETKPLPFLAPALLRQLQELPSLRDGLSHTERLVLQTIATLGRPAFGQVFAEINGRHETLPFLNDAAFHAVVRLLIETPDPAIREFEPHRDWPHRPLELTALGNRILAGDAYWLDHARDERWVGGIRLEPKRPHWALNEQLFPQWRAR